MCGIFGSIRLDGSDNYDESIVAEGVRLLTHRGPDGHGVSVMGPVCFGHSRLSIIDLTGGRQPMTDATGKGLITYNGEVYNFREINKDLESTGRRFLTNSDTEVVLNAFLQWNDSCLKHFRGMFAFACFDEESKEVLIARDRVGKKPLFYTIKNNTLYFSSELEPLYLTVGPFLIDLEAMDDYLYWQYIPAPRTIYREVYCLPPAHYISINPQNGEVSPARYWNLKFQEDETLDFDDWVDVLDKTIREAVNLRLVSDVPFGAFLSGGIDSSLVVSYMSEILDKPVKTFSIGFENADYSELRYAEQVAKICHTDHHTQIVKAESLKILPLLVRHYGQPFADSSAIPTYYVSRMAREGVKMVLSGDGGDENFAGYNPYEHILSRKNGKGQYLSHLKVFASRWYNKFDLWRCLGDASLDVFEMYCSLYSHFTPQQRQALYRTPYKDLINAKANDRRKILESGNGPLVSRLQYLDIMTYLPYDILTKVDIASMANSLEVRSPLLDHRLMEVAATVPARFKLHSEQHEKKTIYVKKHILKVLAMKRFPRDLIDRPKLGFGIPLGEWFAGELNSEVRSRLLTSKYLPSFFDMHIVEGVLDRHSLRQDMSARLWNLLFLDEWMKQHEGAL